MRGALGTRNPPALHILVTRNTNAADWQDFLSMGFCYARSMQEKKRCGI